uniref:Ig-like domain-containing protein n=1 Tax=Pygocentrus nattereri TaxID=42514 RepID=A0A3B4CM48_PYGNA
FINVFMTKILYNPLVISAEPGEAVNLTCTFVDDSDKEVRMWYKQRIEHAPLEVGSKLEDKPAVIPGQFDKSRFKLNRIASGISLSIERVTKEDEGMYFCGETGKKTLNFSTATFLAVTGQSDISVLQTSVRGSVSPGELVTLQCTVLSEIRAADLRVLWLRAAAGQSFPEIIYTHQNSSSRQCEISSSTSCSLYEFSKNILNQHHTGTYYCAVAVCGKIIFGNGTSVELSKSFCALLGTCVADMIILFYFSFTFELVFNTGNSEASLTDTILTFYTLNLHYAAIHIKEKKAKGGRVKREQPEDIVYSQVRSSKAAAHRSHH